jgi:hypothetical protein
MAGAAGRLIALAAAGAALIAAAPLGPVQAFAGRYSHHFKNGTVFGETYWSDDVVEVVPVDPGHAYVRFALDFYNGHSCSLQGIARAEDTALVYHEPAAERIGEKQCVLRIERRGNQLVWDDAGGSCKDYCGARGSLSNGSLAWRSKRAVTYLPRLKRSEDYLGALAAWRKDGAK